MTHEELKKLIDDNWAKWCKNNPNYTEEQKNFYWSGISQGVYLLYDKLKNKTPLQPTYTREEVLELMRLAGLHAYNYLNDGMPYVTDSEILDNFDKLKNQKK